MKNLIIGILVGLAIGVPLGIGGGIFAFPFLFPPPPLNEVVADSPTRQRVASGTFIHADPSDPVHYGSGGVSVYNDLLHLESDFKVGPGPKYHVYLVPDQVVTPATPVDNGMFIDLGRLKAFSGGQNYTIPAGVDHRQYGSVVIWCEQFGVLISPAQLVFD
jgi:hypothetical protein